jgi:hypothetical protein
MMHPICYRNTATVSEMGPMIAVGSAKSLGLKVKPVYGSESPRATRVRDKMTQRMANILVHLVPHRQDPTSLSFISKSRLGGFLHASMWVGI